MRRLLFPAAFLLVFGGLALPALGSGVGNGTIDKQQSSIPSNWWIELWRPQSGATGNHHTDAYTETYNLSTNANLRVKLCFQHRHGAPFPRWEVHAPCSDSGTIFTNSVNANKTPGCQPGNDDYKYYSDHWKGGAFILRFQGIVHKGC